MTKPGGRVAALRIALDLSHEAFVRSEPTPFQRPQMVRFENEDYGVNSYPARDAVRAAFGLTHEQLDAFMRGDTSLSEALRLSAVKTRRTDYIPILEAAEQAARARTARTPRARVTSKAAVAKKRAAKT